MTADLSNALPPLPQVPLRARPVAAALVAAVAVTVLAFCSFGIVFDLLVVVVARAAGAGSQIIAAAGLIGAAVALYFSGRIGMLAFRYEQDPQHTAR